MDYDTPSFSFLHILFISFFHRITQSYRNILAPRITPRITHGFDLTSIG